MIFDSVVTIFFRIQRKLEEKYIYIYIYNSCPKEIVLTMPWDLFNLYAEYIMRNTGLEEAQAGNKIAGRNINNLRYADDTTCMAESEKLA